MSAQAYRDWELRHDWTGYLVACSLFALGPNGALQSAPDGAFLRAFRDATRLSQAQAGALIDVSIATWSRHENSPHPLPTWITLAVSTLYRYPATRERQLVIPDMARWTLERWPGNSVPSDIGRRTCLRWSPGKARQDGGTGDWQWYAMDIADAWVEGRNMDGTEWPD